RLILLRIAEDRDALPFDSRGPRHVISDCKTAISTLMDRMVKIHLKSELTVDYGDTKVHPQPQRALATYRQAERLAQEYRSVLQERQYQDSLGNFNRRYHEEMLLEISQARQALREQGVALTLRGTYWAGYWHYFTHWKEWRRDLQKIRDINKLPSLHE